jgi:hypothetical protein
MTVCPQWLYGKPGQFTVMSLGIKMNFTEVSRVDEITVGNMKSFVIEGKAPG